MTRLNLQHNMERCADNTDLHGSKLHRNKRQDFEGLTDAKEDWMQDTMTKNMQENKA